MLRAPAFRYLAPTSVAEATTMLHAEGSAAKVLAGGTDLIPNMKRQQQIMQASANHSNVHKTIESIRKMMNNKEGDQSRNASVASLPENLQSHHSHRTKSSQSLKRKSFSPVNKSLNAGG